MRAKKRLAPAGAVYLLWRYCSWTRRKLRILGLELTAANELRDTMNIFCLLTPNLLTRNSKYKSTLGATFQVKPKPLDFSWLKFTHVSFSHVTICLLFCINLWNYAQTPFNYRVFLIIKKNYRCIYICPSPGGAGCSHKMGIAGCIYVGHNEPLWAPVHRHAQKAQTVATVSLGSHTQKRKIWRGWEMWMAPPFYFTLPLP